ncbi:membrane protein [Trema orientale]|uniref:Membrane protein n=1 Tax=Trema orientale TaxID=63057 RepID=A0A2P5BFY2_TREOI|nr:membrane protein [Trema orientale]
MKPLKIHQPHLSFFLSRYTPPPLPLPLPLRPSSHFKPTRLWFSPYPIPYSSGPTFKLPRVSDIEPSVSRNEEEKDESSPQLEDLSPKGAVYRKTLALVECSMFAALTGLVYFLSNSLAIENYFGCFFSLPIVISSMRWGIPAGRKTMVATTMLLLVLSGPVKALTYLLKHGLVGYTMGSLWRSGSDWKLSIFLCTIVRALGAVGYVLISSFLIRENILALITINIHASLTFLFTASGVYTVPSMDVIYTIFGILVLLNSGSFMFLLHLLYSVFLTRLGMRALLRMPKWLEKAI